MTLNSTILLFACIAQAGLTFCIALVLFARRIAEMKRRKIHPQSIANSVQSLHVMEDVRASDNFRNLFEVPVLFYALCALLLVTKSASMFLAVAAWVFVVLRCIHSWIQCTNNKVMHRFYVFTASTLLLLLMWIVFALDMVFAIQ